ncbi:MAG: HepT-like ribonuclease domain-containing protein [Dehalococcoidia bacterium]
MKQPDDETRTGHIVDAGERILRWTEGKSRADLDADDQLQSAVAYQLQIIGEAASHLSEDFRRTYADIPWRRIIGMRHILVHAYMDVDLDLVWDVLAAHLTPLMDTLRPLVPPETEL